MRLPRDIGGQDLARRLAVYDYTIIRQTGGHLKLMSNRTGQEHQITLTTGRMLRMATFNSVLVEVARYLTMEKNALAASLFAP